MSSVHRFRTAPYPFRVARMVIRRRGRHGRCTGILPQRLSRHPKTLAFVIALALLTLYWGGIASPRYVSEMDVIVQRNGDGEVAQSTVLSLIAGSNGDSADMLLLRERLLSSDVLLQLDTQLGLQEHFSASRIDVFSRLHRKSGSRSNGKSDTRSETRLTTNEAFLDYARSRIDVVYDDYAHMLRIRAQAFTPAMAQRITQALGEEGERFVNRLGNQQAAEQHRFIDTQLSRFRESAQQAREAVLTFQNLHGMVSPVATVESVAQVVARLDQERAELTASRNTLAVYLTPQAPEMIKVEAQIAALSRQMVSERGRLTQGARQAGGEADGPAVVGDMNAPNAMRAMRAAPADRLNRLAAEQLQLQNDATFAEALYATSRTALERARIESIRKLKTLAVVQSPTLPEESTLPRRGYSIVVWTLGLALLSALFFLVRAIVREHRD